jgi:hypothetical protein
VQILERIIRRAPVGLRFTDLVRRATVNDGLRVEAWASDTTTPRFLAYRSPVSGVYGFRSLPGLQGYENGERPASDFCNGGSSDNFVITVDDTLGRYLPQVLLICLPKEEIVEVQLFSSPARPTPSGQGVIRGEVWDRVAGGPAGWALITATIGTGDPLVTVADARGMFALFVPYSAALPSLTGDPPASATPLGEIQWDVTLRTLCQPASQRRVRGSDVPDTRSVLEQPAGTICSVINPDGSVVSAPTLVRSLRFGQELVATTENSARLIINPAP